MGEYPREAFQFDDLTSLTAFRIIELLPGHYEDPICFLSHTVDLESPPQYEAISYVWGGTNVRAPRSTVMARDWRLL